MNQQVIFGVLGLLKLAVDLGSEEELAHGDPYMPLNGVLGGVGCSTYTSNALMCLHLTTPLGSDFPQKQHASSLALSKALEGGEVGDVSGWDPE